MESDIKGVATSKDFSIIDGATLLHSFVENNADLLLRTLRSYARRAGFTESDAAKELLNEVFIEALEHAERFDSSRQPMAWLLGIAANLICRKKAKTARRNKHEIRARACGSNDKALSEDEIFERLAHFSVESAAEETEANEEVNRMLALVGEEDQKVLRLAVLEEMDGKSLAQAIGIAPGAARVRLFRAIGRLREALLNQQSNQGGKR